MEDGDAQEIRVLGFGDSDGETSQTCPMVNLIQRLQIEMFSLIINLLIESHVSSTGSWLAFFLFNSH